jgi:thiamine-phosphate pyrophosphorylase
MPDLSLYLVTDRSLSLGRSTVDIVRAAVAGGVTCVQLREKSCTTGEFVAQARAVRELLAGTGVPLIINDRVDVALAVGADGVHLGQSDMPLRDARAILGPTRLIGISAECLDDAVRAAADGAADGADYVGISPVFPTPTKTDTALPLGLDGIRAIRTRIRIPLVGIGGIGPANAAEVIRAGCDGIAVVSAIVSAADPCKAARELTTIIRMAKEAS